MSCDVGQLELFKSASNLVPQPDARDAVGDLPPDPGYRASVVSRAQQTEDEVAQEGSSSEEGPIMGKSVVLEGGGGVQASGEIAAVVPGLRTRITELEVSQSRGGGHVGPQCHPSFWPEHGPWCQSWKPTRSGRRGECAEGQRPNVLHSLCASSVETSTVCRQLHRLDAEGTIFTLPTSTCAFYLDSNGASSHPSA